MKFIKLLRSSMSLQSSSHISNEHLSILKPKSDYSTAYFWEDTNTNSGLMYGHNICFNPESAEVFLYLPPGETLNRTRLDESAISYRFSLDFRWGWTLREVKAPYSPFKVYSEPGVVVNYLAFSNHIYHALEGMGLLLHKLFSAEDFPYVTIPCLFNA